LNEISFLFMARSLGYLIGSLLGGRLYDRVPGHPVMTVVLVVMAAMLALTPVLPLLWLLTAALLILGLGEGVLDVGGNTLLVWAHRDKVAPFMNGLHFFFGVGALLSPIIIAQKVLVSGDINWAYWTLAALVLPVAVLLLRLPVPTVLKVSKDSPQAKVNYLLIVLIAIFFFLHVGAEASMGGWIFTYATALNLTSKTMAAYLTSTFWGALTLGRLLAIPVSTRFRPRYVLLADLVGCLVSVGVILLSKSLVGVWLGTCGAGLCIASIFPTTISFAERRMTITGQVTGWFFVGSSLGGMFLPWLIGQLFESIGPRVTMLAILSDLMLALGVFAVLILYSARSVKSRE
jgi:fucose permease